MGYLIFGVFLLLMVIGVPIGLSIGMATPPVAINIYVASAITGLTMGKISKPIIPMVLILILVLFICLYVPDVVLFLPRLIMK